MIHAGGGIGLWTPVRVKCRDVSNTILDVNKEVGERISGKFEASHGCFISFLDSYDGIALRRYGF